MNYLYLKSTFPLGSLLLTALIGNKDQLSDKCPFICDVICSITKWSWSDNDHVSDKCPITCDVIGSVTKCIRGPSLLNLMMMEANMIPMASRNRRGWAFNARCHEKALTLRWQWYLMIMDQPTRPCWLKKRTLVFIVTCTWSLNFEFLREPLMLNWASTIKKSKCGTLNLCTIYWHCGNVTFPLFYQVLFKCHRYADTFEKIQASSF